MMSKSFGLKCRNCDKYTCCGCQRYAVDSLANLARHAHDVKVIMSYDVVMRLLDLRTDTWWTSWNEDDDDVPLLDFLAQHAGHDIIIFDEYGNEYGNLEHPERITLAAKN